MWKKQLPGFAPFSVDSNTQISRGSVPLLPLKETTNEAAPAEVSMNMSAFKTLEREVDECGNVEKVKFSRWRIR